MDNTIGMVKIGFRDGDGDVETLWATPIDSGFYRLENSPFFAYGVSFGDIVEAVPEEDGFLFFARVIERSAHRTVRVLIVPDSDYADTFYNCISELGCSYEGASSKLIAIDIPLGVSLESVTSYLTSIGIEWEYANPTYEEVLSNK